jgi:signal transduction histidine kinase
LERLESRKVNSESGTFDISLFLQRMADDTDGQRKPGQNIVYRHEGPATVVADQNILRNVITNLLSNAIKYSEDQVTMRSMVKDGMLTIEVEDKGIGIPESAQSNIFGKFFRAGNAGHIQGTGLGLMIVKRYVELLGGSIGFVSTQDQGTCFTVKIPC